MSMIGLISDYERLRATITGGNGVLANGTSITVTTTAEATLIGGFPPFTHSWTDTGAAVFVQASTSITTRLQATGTNIEHQGSLIYIVTDAAGYTATASTSINIIQGTP